MCGVSQTNVLETSAALPGFIMAEKNVRKGEVLFFYDVGNRNLCKNSTAPKCLLWKEASLFLCWRSHVATRRLRIWQVSTRRLPYQLYFYLFRVFSFICLFHLFHFACLFLHYIYIYFVCFYLHPKFSLVFLSFFVSSFLLFFQSIYPLVCLYHTTSKSPLRTTCVHRRAQCYLIMYFLSLHFSF